MALLVAPIAQRGGLQLRREFVQNVVFPKPPQVVGPQGGPAAKGAHKARVETIDLGAAMISLLRRELKGRTTSATAVASRTPRKLAMVAGSPYRTAHTGQLAVEILNVGQGLSEGGLARPANTAQPYSERRRQPCSILRSQNVRLTIRREDGV